MRPALLCLAVAVSGCGAIRIPKSPPEPSPLVVALCTQFEPLQEDSFGAWVLWAQYAAASHARCLGAIFGDVPPEP